MRGFGRRVRVFSGWNNGLMTSPDTSHSALDVRQDGKVLWLTIRNPPKNAMTRSIHGELAHVFDDISRDPQIAVVVLTGAGESFCAGGDLHAMARRLAQNEHADWVQGNREALQIIAGMLRLNKPLIARINGDAIGIGATLAVLSDISVALDDARIADSHVKVGLAAGDGGALLWPLLIGFARARRYLLTGDTMTGREAAEFGLVTESVPTIAALDTKVGEWAERLAKSATLAVGGTKVAINLVLRRLFEGLAEAHLGIETATYLSRDHEEAVKAFIERRPPIFTGT